MSVPFTFSINSSKYFSPFSSVIYPIKAILNFLFFFLSGLSLSRLVHELVFQSHTLHHMHHTELPLKIQMIKQITEMKNLGYALSLLLLKQQLLNEHLAYLQLPKVFYYSILFQSATQSLDFLHWISILPWQGGIREQPGMSRHLP